MRSLRSSDSSDIKNVIAPSLRLELLDAFRSARSFFIPDFDNAARSIDVLEHALAWLRDTDASVQIWVFFWCKAGSNGPEESKQIVRVGDASSTKTFAGIEELAVGGVEEISQSRSLIGFVSLELSCKH